MQKILMFALFLAWSSAATSAKYLPSGQAKIGAFPCPDAEDISPCVCSSSQSSMDLDCSKVISDSQLASVFQASFPATKFHAFIINNNHYIQKLSNIFRGKTFALISLYNTSLHTVTENAFDDSIDTITSIEIIDSPLTTQTFNVSLWKFPNLNGVYLLGDSLSTAPAINSSSIYTVYLNLNKIEALQAGMIKESTNLTGLHMQNNKITTLPTHAFDLPTHSLSLYLDGNNISTVQKNAFALPPDTKELKLQLSLTHNNITTLDEAVYGPVFPFITQIHLASNPLECGCDVAWIVLKSDYLYKVDHQTTCADGQTFRNLNPYEYEEYC